MKIPELMQLREDALSVIIELYRMPPTEPMPSPERQFALQRAVAMFNAALEYLKAYELATGNCEGVFVDQDELDALNIVKEHAYAVVKAWTTRAIDLSHIPVHIVQATLNLCGCFPRKRGDA